MNELKKQVALIAKDLNNYLSEDFCSGYPYLKLDRFDYHINPLDVAYADYAKLLKALALEDNWKTNKVSFFDIHPIFSNAEPIPGLMGFHLSLQIFQKGLASATETLYFDTKTNWLKVSPIFENRAYSVSSWIKYNRNDVLDNVEDGVNSDLFFPVNILLAKGAELASINKQAPVNFDSNLLDWYASNDPIQDSEKYRKILHKEIELFQEAMTEIFEKDADKFADSAVYLYALIFCREFGFSHEVFRDVTSRLDVSFGFSSEADIIHYSQCCFGYLDGVKIKVGDYDKLELNRNQLDLTFIPKPAPETPPEQNISVEEDEKNSIKPLEESVVTYHTQGYARFYEMKKALDSERECRILITKIWTRLVQCFYLDKLTAQNFSLMRNLMDMHVVDIMKMFNVLKRENYDIQYKVMQDAAYSLFVKVDAEYRNVGQYESSLCEEIYKRIRIPDLTPEQTSQISLMNTAAKKEFIENFHEDLKINFLSVLKSTTAKFNHSSTIKEHGGRFKSLEPKAFPDLVMRWYIDNYVNSYFELSNEYDFIIKRIESDKNRCEHGSYFMKSLIAEIKMFLKTQDNPFHILDLNALH